MKKRQFLMVVCLLLVSSIVLLLNACSGNQQGVQDTISTTTQTVYASPKGPGEPIIITQAISGSLGQVNAQLSALNITGLPSGITASQSCENNRCTVIFSGSQSTPASPGQTVISIQSTNRGNVLRLPLIVEYPQLGITVPSITVSKTPGTITLTNFSNVLAQITNRTLTSASQSWHFDSSTNANTCEALVSGVLAPKESCTISVLNSGIYESGEFAIQPSDSWYLSDPTAMLVPEIPQTQFSFTQALQKQQSSPLLLDADVTLTNNSEFSLPSDAVEAEFIGDYGDGATTVELGDCFTNGVEANGGHCTFRVKSEDVAGLIGTTDMLRLLNSKAGNKLIAVPEFGIPSITVTLSGGQRKGSYQRLLVTAIHQITFASPAYVFEDNDNGGNQLVEVKEPLSGTETEADTCSGQTISAGGQCYIWLHAIKQNSPTSNEVKVQIKDRRGDVVSGTQSVIASTYLYAGGIFTTAGGNDANNIAKWDGSTWSALGDGINGLVTALTTDSNDMLYAGGQFTTAGGNNVNNIAKWDGSSWDLLGLGVEDIGEGVLALTTGSRDVVYAGGQFTTAGGSSASNIAKWDGSSWSPLGNGVNNFIIALTTDSNDNVYAGGEFTTADGAPAFRVAKWDGSTWSALGDGMNRSVSALITGSNDVLYAGGGFTTADGAPAFRVAKWDGVNWSPLGDGMNDSVTTLTADSHDDVYAGGFFTTAGGNSANYVARWDGSSWSPLGDGTNTFVFALTADGNNDIYAGGEFTTAGGVSARHVAKWDGSTWSALGTGVENSNGISVESLIIAPSILIP
ncbi:MAG: hypothetical protein AAGA27_03085 [Pseudomonadota bacterium]